MGKSIVDATRGMRVDDYHNKGMTPRPGVAPQGVNAVPSGSHSMVQENTAAIGCQMPKKDGSACQAAPIKTQPFCVGHMKAVEKANS